MYSYGVYIMRFIFLAILCCSCGALPQLTQTVDDLITEDAIKIIVSKEAVEQKKNINVIVEIKKE